jgi:probable Rubsico expression protein CbbX
MTAGAETPAGAGTLDLDAAYRDSQVGDVLGKLDRELIGLAPVKTRIREIAHLLLIDRLRAQFGLAATRPPLHMSFTGPPGTGKTTVAMRMAEILNRLGYLRKGHVVIATRDDLVGQYIGHTAPKTKEMLKRAMGGVLFIDEAYYLYKPENERDYGAEAIEILLQVMEAQRDDIVVIFAGYHDRMQTFFASNPGLRSRVTNHIDFPDYSTHELQEIAATMLASLNYVFTPAAERAFAEYLELRRLQPQFANARSVRNAIDRARLRAATRLFEHGGVVTREQLMQIDEPDIRKSRIFDSAGGV